MKKSLLSILLFSTITFGYSTVITVTNVAFKFSPDPLTITVGDSVRFTVNPIHKPVELSQVTWNANDTTHLPGGFDLPFGGGLVPASLLTVGTHWYVCYAHVQLNGMKDQIIVNPATGIKIYQDEYKISLYPNPVNSIINLRLNIPESQKALLTIINIAGQEIMNQQIINGENQIDVEKLLDGIYHVMIMANKKQIYNEKFIIK
jgi:plastocyanin